MTIYLKQCKEQLIDLQNLLKTITPLNYTKQSHYLHKATIGQHTRHIIEMTQCVINGYNVGIIDYINRNRNLQYETDIEFSIIRIDKLLVELDKENKLIQIKITEIKNPLEEFIHTNYFREILFITEHTIHHLALIKVALIEFNIAIENPFFGTAYSTIQYKTAT